MKSNRRKFFKRAATGAATLGVAASGFSLASCNKPHTVACDVATGDDPILQMGEGIAVVNTTNGDVQGFKLRGINTFLGIPYGANTAGENRFMPPKKPEPWTDIKPVWWWGNSAPQQMAGRYSNPGSTFLDHWNYDELSEDCLKLNIWSPEVNDKVKRPVLVWLHGGGFRNGNAIEQDGYHGENLSRKGDMVFCSLNHRLGPMGFTNLADVAGSKFISSGNVGMLDIVFALKWVRDNIENFGGDPDNVTIMGQSGGGAKVCMLMAMPSAEGLFHKAVPLSGSSINAQPKADSEKLGAYVWKEAGGSIEKLQEMPWQEFLDLSNIAAEKFKEEVAETEGRRGGFTPVENGIDIPLGEFFSDPEGLSTNIPMMICTTFHEWSPSKRNPSLEEIDFNGVVSELKGKYGEKSAEILKAFRNDFPKATPIEIYGMIMSSRESVIKTANAKINQNSSVYLAWFGWQPPHLDGTLKAFHCLDICFWFDNTDLMYTHTGGGSRPRVLGDKMSEALVHFMKTGNPNGSSLPIWPKYSKEEGETMILNDVCEVKRNPDAEARASLS
ncbi:carboxylesterase/lipase family protein [Arcticibacterium luteifluviistationis]|uniref:Carboxylic ester hydrolase n=1 Tax=Arcticibacterium luteifluviistationis TaxID=1784714 RepID=A0A2Z4GFN2_9BACT|nr:carboxylesterase family protein [Arcticibacterium luteifluviistationis]AWV99877.1 carboxylesterase [Arcticibacterium luteifluviistationis]